MCDEKGKRSQNSAVSKVTSHKMRYHSDKVIMKGRQIASLPIKELIREVDSEEEESNCVTSEFEDEAKLVDKIVRVSIKNATKIVSDKVLSWLQSLW